MPGQGTAGPGRWAGDHSCLWLPGTPWWVRCAGTPDGRGALEVYEGGELLDVVVDTPVARLLLRGARQAGRGEHAVAFAWGGTAPGGDVAVGFSRRPRGRSRATPATVATPWCWIAVAQGRFSHVVAIRGEARGRRALTRALAW